MLVNFFLSLSFCGYKYFCDASYSSWIWEEDPSDPNQGVFEEGQDFHWLQDD